MATESNTKGSVKKLGYNCKGWKFSKDFSLFNLEGADIVLAMHWLENLERNGPTSRN